ncbi:MAG: nicotinamide mononucleotide transporter [Chlamydia sp.]
MMQEWITIISWIFSIISVSGTYLLANGSIHGFSVGIVTNFVFFLLNFYHGDFAQSFLFLVNFLVSLYGVWAWNKKKSHGKIEAST